MRSSQFAAKTVRRLALNCFYCEPRTKYCELLFYCELSCCELLNLPIGCRIKRESDDNAPADELITMAIELDVVVLLSPPQPRPPESLLATITPL